MTFFFLSFLYFLSRLNTAKHQMFKVVNYWSFLQICSASCTWVVVVPAALFPLPPTPPYWCVVFFFKVKVQPQLKLQSESGSKCLATEQREVGRVTFSVVVCPRFSEMITFWGLRGRSHFQVWMLTHVLPFRATERKGGDGGSGVREWLGEQRERH